ncbi:riboflavin biosynthesis protein [Lysobacter bugurensis]|uniref:Riboflavin biosynthesis protein n=1 Tax=Cognatilysobacter bugurensis TaxID=543356 RepID=A0A918SWL5_9GAMM|nr:riboflavin biosynthesis protein [Lysobacter bugurensis]
MVCIGAFDGLHLGHRALVRHTVSRARSLALPAVALSFEPLPREFFARGEAMPRLSTARAKARGLWALGIDQVGLLRFNTALSALSAETFVERVLVDRLQAREVWVGPGFGFGHRRGGTLSTLQTLGKAHGFSAAEIEPVLVDAERVSSTAIREALRNGDFEHASRLLGRPYAIEGRVVRGRQLGRTLGYPTANLRLGGRVPALTGIFAVRVTGVEGRVWPAVASLGTRPTVDGVEPLLEVHLFDFDGDLYGRCIEVEFVAKLRDEVRFESLDALTEQMHRDAAQARDLLTHDQRRAFG